MPDTPVDRSNLPFASIENIDLRLDYLTSLGPRIMGLYAKGVEGNLFAVTTDQHWPTPHGEYYLYGGHRLWTAPEDPFYTVPEGNVSILSETNKITLRSSVDASGLEKEISFQLVGKRVALSHKITWHGNEPIELAPWAITQVRLGGMAILPQSRSDNGLLPNRNLVLWPYSRLADERLSLHDDLILLHGRAAEEACKIGSYNPYGWIAYAMGQALFIKRFKIDESNRYPDMGCNVEAYVKNSCVELETLGALKTLEPHAPMTYEENWEVLVGEYPVTLETARTISKKLS
jgi:hypothetical protein